MFRRFRIVALAGALMAAGCSHQVMQKNDDPPLLDGTWQVRKLGDSDVAAVNARLTFDSKNMRVSGFDGCNRIAGEMEMTGAEVRAARLVSTRMACRGEEAQRVSQAIHVVLSEGGRVEGLPSMGGTALMLSRGDVRIGLAKE